MTAILSSSQSADGIPACSMLGDSAGVSCGDLPRESVSAVRHIGIRELEAHAASCHYLMQLAKARYRGSKALPDAQEAGRWLVLKEEAQKAVLTLRREQFDADHLDMAGEWTAEVRESKQA